MLRVALETPAALPGSIGALLIGLTAACAPSFESVHEGNLRFEHCYRLDHDPQIPSNQREYCWNDWVRVYTYGQTLDRRNYASRRLRVLRGEPPPGVQATEPLAIKPESLEPPRVASAAAPPTTPDNDPPTAKDAPLTKPELPLVACSRTCETTLNECKATCQVAPKGCVPCDPSYKECMQRCIE